MKIAKSIEKLGSMIESVREIIKNETKKKQKDGMLLATLDTSVLGNLLAVKGNIPR